MSKRTDFVTILQTTVLYLRPKLEIGLDLICEAMALPEEAIPENLRKAAMDLWEHFVNRKPSPEWLTRYREEKADQEKADKDVVQIELNRMADADLWWMSAEACADTMPKQCRSIVCERNVILLRVPRAVAEHFRDWGAGIPGWDARPFSFFDVEGKQIFE